MELRVKQSWEYANTAEENADLRAEVTRLRAIVESDELLGDLARLDEENARLRERKDELVLEKARLESDLRFEQAETQKAMAENARLREEVEELYTKWKPKWAREYINTLESLEAKNVVEIARLENEIDRLREEIRTQAQTGL